MTDALAGRSGPSLLLVNQSVGPLFMGVVAAAARRHRSVLMQGRSTMRLPPGVVGINAQPYQCHSVAGRLFSWGLFSAQLASLLLHERLRSLVGGCRFQHLLIVSNPPLAPLLARLAGRPYALLLYDLYPEVLDQLVVRSPGRSWLHSTRAAGLAAIKVVWTQLNSWVFSGAEAVITLSPGMAECLKPYFRDASSWQQRVHVVPPWADTALIRPVPPHLNAFRREHGLEGRFLVLYSGNLGLTHPLEHLVDAIDQLIPNGDGSSRSLQPSHHNEGSCSQGLASEFPIELVIIGSGPKRPSLQRRAAALKLRQLHLLDLLPIEQVSHSYSAADLAVVCLDGPAAQASLPSKTFTALATGTPILALAPQGSELAALVERHQCGVVVPPGEAAPAAIASVLRDLASDPERCAAMAQRSLQASQAYRETNADRLVDIWLDASSSRSTSSC